MNEPIVSRPFHPAMACEACVFRTGEHAEWCENGALIRSILTEHLHRACDTLMEGEDMSVKKARLRNAVVMVPPHQTMSNTINPVSFPNWHWPKERR